MQTKQQSLEKEIKLLMCNIMVMLSIAAVSKANFTSPRKISTR